MITRIVKMTFMPEKTGDFLTVFEASKAKIRAFDGCMHLELLNDIQQANIFFTYSKWESEEALDKYRHSELFKTTWSKTKALFQGKAEAWSVMQKDEVIS